MFRFFRYFLIFVVTGLPSYIILTSADNSYFDIIVSSIMALVAIFSLVVMGMMLFLGGGCCFGFSSLWLLLSDALADKASDNDENENKDSEDNDNNEDDDGDDDDDWL